MYETITKLIKTLSSDITAFLILVTFAGFLYAKSKTFKNWIKKTLNNIVHTDEQNQQMQELSNQIQELSEHIKKQNDEQNIHEETTSKSLEIYQEGLVYILAKELKCMCKEIADKETISEEQYKDIFNSYKIYQKCGGNGWISDLVNSTLAKKKSILSPNDN